MLGSMERAPLRPVPSGPPGPVDPAEATRYVERMLPGLDVAAVAALALVQLAGCSREEAAARAGLPLDDAGAALARARKELRRSRAALPGSGWCERAERLISDRFDAALEPPGPRRLEVHLRNCARCVEHERRVVQAIDVLVADFVAETDQLVEAAGYLPAPELAEPAGPELSVVDAPASPPPLAAPWRAVPLPQLPPGEPAPAVRPAAPLGAPAPPSVRPPADDISVALAEDIVGARAASAEPELEAPEPDVEPPEPELEAPEPDMEAAEPEPAPVPVPAPLATGPGLPSRVVWAVLLALAVALAVGSVAIAVLGVLGGSL